MCPRTMPCTKIYWLADCATQLSKMAPKHVNQKRSNRLTGVVCDTTAMSLQAVLHQRMLSSARSDSVDRQCGMRYNRHVPCSKTYKEPRVTCRHRACRRMHSNKPGTSSNSSPESSHSYCRFPATHPPPFQPHVRYHQRLSALRRCDMQLCKRRVHCDYLAAHHQRSRCRLRCLQPRQQQHHPPTLPSVASTACSSCSRDRHSKHSPCTPAGQRPACGAPTPPAAAAASAAPQPQPPSAAARARGHACAGTRSAAAAPALPAAPARP
ncbi:hypothetical protein COO60DRAFT_865573 [Scenedesmus sp. NREL 46B-D3]|nr:hypothetical protein COO60DRAFT_865573 [Scenedesmus sp. NREL 46B-D3]